MKLERESPCKVNLLLNILGKRADGFHELETVMLPIPLHDTIEFTQADGKGIDLTCSDPTLAVDSSNLVHRAAAKFFDATGIRPGIRIHLEKRIPMAAGLGGGSGNAANTLLGLNELFGSPLGSETLQELAASLGSDVPFFLRGVPALAVGRGEQVTSLPPFSGLAGKAILLIHPGFGISTAWAYQKLAEFPKALNGERGRAQRLVDLLKTSDFSRAAKEFYNSLEAPAFQKHPILLIYQEFLRKEGASAVLMSGSGSTTFAIVSSEALGHDLSERFKARFGEACWTAVVSI